MGNISLKIKIGNRVYPLSINEADLDQAKRAEELVNENINKLKADFGLNDPVDLLAMTAFELANSTLNKNESSGGNSSSTAEVEKKLLDINERIKELITLD